MYDCSFITGFCICCLSHNKNKTTTKEVDADCKAFDNTRVVEQVVHLIISKMGNRVKGRVKPKSIKAAKHSGMGSKRKLSRMGKNIKKNNAGTEATFLGRAKAIKKLQITLKDFRRLCILKGIYPREPRGRKPGNKKDQVYYHIKDIRALSHEPLLMQFREFKTFMKKVREKRVFHIFIKFPVFMMSHFCELFSFIGQRIVMKQMKQGAKMQLNQSTL